MPSVGDTIYHQVTNEAGRIVRIIEVDGAPAYVVLITNPVSGSEVEALWRPFELEENRENGRDAASSDS